VKSRLMALFATQQAARGGELAAVCAGPDGRRDPDAVGPSRKSTAWFGIADARRKIPKGQMVFVDRLLESAMAVCHDNRQYRPDTTDTGPTMFDLMFLRTSARVPSADRNHPGLLVEAGVTAS
jgi:hypothetical protein